MNSTVYVRFAFVLLMFTTGSLAGFTETAEKKANINEGAKGGVDQNMTYLTVSGELARLASESKDPILMLAAARLEAMVTTKVATRNKTSEGDTTEAGAPKPEKADLFALAEQFAGTNARLQAVIEASKASVQTKGAAGGAILTSDRVLAQSSDYYRIRFRGGEPVRIAVLGDGDSDLDLYVYDENGNLVCRDTDYSDQTYCSWTPAWTATFRIKIENLGSVYNRYRLATN